MHGAMLFRSARIGGLTLSRRYVNSMKYERSGDASHTRRPRRKIQPCRVRDVRDAAGQAQAAYGPIADRHIANMGGISGQDAMRMDGGKGGH
jgi:hypothetical protein